MTWDDITVYQFQQLAALPHPATELEQAERVIQTVCIVYNLTERQVDSLSLADYHKLLSGLTFLNAPPEWKPAKHFTANKRRYRLVYDVRQIHAGRYIEVKHFAQDFVTNMHKVAASIIIPQRRNALGIWKDAKYDAAQHERYAEDILQAPITAIHGSAVFFCKLYTTSMRNLKDYLMPKIPTEMRAQAEKALIDSCGILDGSINAALSPNMSV